MFITSRVIVNFVFYFLQLVISEGVFVHLIDYLSGYPTVSESAIPMLDVLVGILSSSIPPFLTVRNKSPDRWGYHRR